MRFSLSALVRLIGLVGLAFTFAAIGLGRAAPRAPGHRVETAPRYVGVNGSTFEPPISESYLLDTEEGGLYRINPVGGVLIEFAGCPPWRDDRGGIEIIGRASETRGADTRKSFSGSGLARLTQFGPPTVDLTASYPAITGRPCWVPGSTSRVVYPAGDGALYAQEFAGPDAAGEASEPRAVAWACPPPGAGSTRIEDPVVPVVPALGGRLLVALSHANGGGGSVMYGNPEIWWLKLGPAGDSILSAGRLVAATDPNERSRMPNLSVAADGRVVLTYLSCTGGEMGWHLRLARIVIDPATGDPVVGPAGVCDLGGGFSMNLPSFSPDGRWVYAIPHDQPPVKSVRRYPVLDSLAKAGAAR